MALETRTVFALIGGTFLLLGIGLHANDRTGSGLLCFTIGFVFSGGWAFLGMALAQQGVGTTPPKTYLSGGMAAVTLALYFGIRTHETLFDR
ncbi:hypothetical protein [Halorarum halobium]|uniref:hypothetical protein n=1 Tax=Halorarum halobium TaxID=3075121 RepID=UPI0028AE2F1D|nr:hypothetical protein [Halobaculum sp. XH14]